MELNVNYILELETKFPHINFDRINTIDSMYITNNENKDMNNDFRIFRETQVKRMLRSGLSPFVSQDLKSKLSYFSQGEDEDETNIYQRDAIQDLQSDETFAIRNIGHATQLIKLPGCNILTDPVFRNLSKWFYPEKTMSYPSIENLPKIDVIIISHNHRDHVDEPSLKALVKQQKELLNSTPKIFVPLGDKMLFENFEFDDIVEVDWYTKITVGSVNFISSPSDHRSGRKGLVGIDHHKSLVTGWIINPEYANVIIKFSGDTTVLTDNNQLAVDSILWNEIKYHKHQKNVDDVNVEIPDIVCFEPSGPNYTRCDMAKTHQSTSYSVLLKFIDALNLANLSGGRIEEFLPKIKTIMMHHNKFELGPDRFNEGLFVAKKLVNYLNLTEDELAEEFIRQRRKLEEADDHQKLVNNTRFTALPSIYTLASKTSILVRAKDFIIDDITFVTEKLKGILRQQQLIDFIIGNTIFPKIGAKLNIQSINNSHFHVESIKKYDAT